MKDLERLYIVDTTIVKFENVHSGCKIFFVNVNAHLTCAHNELTMVPLNIMIYQCNG